VSTSECPTHLAPTFCMSVSLSFVLSESLVIPNWAQLGSVITRSKKKLAPLGESVAQAAGNSQSSCISLPRAGIASAPSHLA
jgi:hypothetical protein